MKVVGHRGASSLALENTVASIKAAKAAGVDAVEIDIRVTRDGELVVCHDSSLERTYKVNKKISELKKSDIATIKSPEGHPLPTLAAALKAAGSTDVIIEGKSSGWSKPLANYLKANPKRDKYIVISFNHHELFNFSQHCPDVVTFVLEHRNPFDAINAARIYGFDGIDVNYWTLNPLVFWLARRHGLSVAVFTVNKPWLASFVRFFYPGIYLTTDVPQKMQFLRPKELRQKRRLQP
jgi:glycerophosphoryl diester phosphodiesterase